MWPGLPELWWRGRLSALIPAMAFTLGLNLLLVMRFVYPQWLSGTLVALAWWVAIGCWIFYVIRSVRELPTLIAPREVSDEPDRFGEAQHAYLRGEWHTAEKLLLGVLAIEPRDPPALLLLSGVYRQTERAEQAEVLIGELSRLEIAERWSLEVEAEQRRIERDRENNDHPEESSENQENPAADLTAA
jgi:hypothetical protein